jgi:hypothetical protein
MSFLQPFLFLGLILVSIPVIIHFLNRSGFKVEPFGAMMFLQQSIKIKARTIKFQQLILLLLKMLFITLLVLALTRPVNLPLFKGSERQATTHVVVIDNSLSMHYGDNENQVFELVRKKALNLVERMESYDNMIVILAGRNPQTLVSSPIFDKLLLKKKLQKLKPGYEKSNIPRALTYALWQLENSTLPRHRIYLFTDSQTISWQPDSKTFWEQFKSQYDKQIVKPGIYVYKIETDKNIRNAAPVNLFSHSPILDCFRLAKFTVDIRNYCSREIKVDLAVYVDDDCIQKRKLEILPGNHAYNFDHEFTKPGAHYIKVVLTGDDFAADNTYYHALNVMKQIPVLLIKGVDQRVDSDFLKMALSTSSAQRDDNLFAITEKTELDLDRLSLEVLNRHKVIILQDIHSLSDFSQFNLEQFVEMGGGILWAPASNANATIYNKLFKHGKGVIPGLLIHKETFIDHPFRPAFPPRKGDFMIDVFNLKNEVTLNSVKVKEYWKCKAADDAIVIADFNKDPFIAYKKFGKGHSILWTCGLGAEWSNFPFTQNYLPLIHNLSIFLASSIQPPINLSLHDPLLYSTERPLSDQKMASTAPLANSIPKSTITDPLQQKHPLTLTENREELQAKWDNTAVAGLYAVDTDSVGKRYFCVTSDPEEGELQILPESKQHTLSDQYQLTFVKNDIRLNELIKRETGYKEWWRTLFILALIVLCLELFLSWRFSL